MHARVLLERNPDSVEVCPHAEFRDVIAVGTYTLQEAEQRDPGGAGLAASGPGALRKGSIELYRMRTSAGTEEAGAELGLRLAHSLDAPAVLDLKWAPPGVAGLHGSLGSRPALAQAGADGNISLYSLKGMESGHCSGVSESDPALELLTSSPAVPAGSDSWDPHADSAMCLALDWSRVGPTPGVAVSMSDGSVAHALVHGERGLLCDDRWEAHGFEAWTCLCDAWRTQVVYSGGDDCSFAAWDLRSGSALPIFRNRKAHSAGVTSMQCCPHAEHLLATGSYDERVRFWDVRMVHQPLETCHVSTGGGVWRIKWHPEDPSALLVAAMHGGLAVVNVPKWVLNFQEKATSEGPLGPHELGPDSENSDNAACESSELGIRHVSMDTEKALVYGADWLQSSSEYAGQGLVGFAIGCSFYERRLEAVAIPPCT